MSFDYHQEQMRLLKRYERHYLKYSCLNPKFSQSLSSNKLML